MKYWPRYVGDFKKKTAALTLLEKGVYTELLDFMYANEEPLPSDMARVWSIVGAHTETEKRAVDVVLNKFFKKNGVGWENERAMEEIAKWHGKSNKAREAIRTRWRRTKGEE